MFYYFLKSISDEQRNKIADIFDPQDERIENKKQESNTDYYFLDKPSDADKKDAFNSSTLSLDGILEEALMEHERVCPFCGCAVNDDDVICNSCNLSIPKEEPKRQIKRKIITASGNELQIKSIATTERFVRYYVDNNKKFNTHCSLYKYTVIDFETANMYPDSVCQMGIAVVEDGGIIEKKTFFIRPPYNDFRNAEIHGITLEDVVNEKTFAELWCEIKPYIENCLVGAYNANFDIGCLIGTLENYKIPVPDFAYFDILQNTREHYREEKEEGYLENFKLKTVAKYLDIDYLAHDALSDVLVSIYVQNSCNMIETYAFMYLNDEKNRELLTHLFTGKEILRVVKKQIEEIESDNIDDYQEIIDLLEVAEKNGADEDKCLCVYGDVLEKCDLLEEALEKYNHAIALNEKARVKGKIKALEKKINKGK